MSVEDVIFQCQCHMKMQSVSNSVRRRDRLSPTDSHVVSVYKLLPAAVNSRPPAPAVVMELTSPSFCCQRIHLFSWSG